MTFEAVRVPEGFQIVAVFDAPNRDKSGAVDNFRISSQRVLPLDAPEPLILRYARNAAGLALLHELDEHFLVDNERIYDPHERMLSSCFCYEAPCVHRK